MKTAEEILISFKTSEFKIYSEEEALKAMKLYAEQAIKHHLEKAAENATLAYVWSFEHHDVITSIDKKSITDIKIELP